MQQLPFCYIPVLWIFPVRLFQDLTEIRLRVHNSDLANPAHDHHLNPVCSSQLIIVGNLLTSSDLNIFGQFDDIVQREYLSGIKSFSLESSILFLEFRVVFDQVVHVFK